MVASLITVAVCFGFIVLLPEQRNLLRPSRFDHSSCIS